MLQPQENDLQLWFMPQLGGDTFMHRIDTPEEGAYLLDAISKYDLYCDRHGLRPDFANSGGVNRYENIDGERDWFTYYDDETGEEVEDRYDVNLDDASHRFVLTFDLKRQRRNGRLSQNNPLKPLVLRFPTRELAKSAEATLTQYQRFVFDSESDSRIDEVTP